MLLSFSKHYKRIYGQYNRLYFNKQLPYDIPVLTTSELPGSWYGKVSYDMHIRRKKDLKGHNYDIIILLNDKNRHNEQKLTLLHEMVHLYLDQQGHTRVQHGKLFQKEMQRLALSGAFAKLW